MANKTVEIDGTAYVLGPISVDQAEEVFSSPNPRQQNKALVAASLVSGGSQTDATPENVGKMFYHHYIPVLNAALEVNGMTTKPAGEAPAAQG